MANPKDITINKAKEQNKLPIASHATIQQKPKILNIVITPRIAYAYYGMPFSKHDIREFTQF